MIDVRTKGNFPGLDRLTEAALLRIGEKAVDAQLSRVTDALAKRHANRPGGTTRKSLARITGKGIDRLKEYDVRTTHDDVQGVIHLTEYMAQHEFGGVIRAKAKDYLAIPLRDALKPDGTPKRASARMWRQARVIRSKRGNLLIVLQQGRRLVPLYALKEHVKIPARLGLRKALRADRPALRRDVARSIKELVSVRERRRNV